MAKRALASVSTDALRKELEHRLSVVEQLEARRDELLGELDALDREIADLRSASGSGRRSRRGARGATRRAGSRRAGGGRKRPRNDTNLVEALAALLAEQTLSVTEAAEEVQKAGYKTTSPNFRTIVNQTLINSGRFKRVSRGKYTTK